MCFFCFYKGQFICVRVSYMYFVYFLFVRNEYMLMLISAIIKINNSP